MAERPLLGVLGAVMKREPVGVAIPLLTLESIEIHRAPVYAGRCPGLEAIDCKSKQINSLGNLDSRNVAGTSSRKLGMQPEMDAAAQESPRRQHYRCRVKTAAVEGRHPAHSAPLQDETPGSALGKVEQWDSFQ